MMAVGSCDAYFCDAYCDVVARTLRARDIEPNVTIPDRLSKLRVPVIAVIRNAGDGWRWRMAARDLIEDETVLSLEKIRGLFNQFFARGTRQIHTETIEHWIRAAGPTKRLFGITTAAYNALPARQVSAARQSAIDSLEDRFELIFQRRHDCIHNCDRPRAALQAIRPGAVAKAIRDIEFLVARMHDALCQEFPRYLQRLHFTGATRARVLQ